MSFHRGPEQPPVSHSGNINRFYVFRFFASFQLWMPIWVVYLIEERGLSLTQVTALDAPFWIWLILMEVPTGAIADRWGHKISLTWGSFVYALALLIFGLAGTFPLLLGSYLVWASAMTLFSGADAAFFYDSLKAAGREEDYQKLWGRARAVQSGGTVLGLLIGAPLAAATNLWFPIVLSAGLMAVSGLVSLTFREPPHADEDDEQLGYVAGTVQAFKVAFGRAAVRTMLLLMAVVFGVGVSMQILAQPFLLSHEVSVSNFGWFLIPGQLLAIAASLTAYRFTSTFGVTRMVILMPLVVMTAAVGLGAWDSLGAFVFYPVSTAIFAMSFPLISDYLNRRIPSSNRATILSIYQLLFSLVIAGMEPFLGALGDHQGLPFSYRLAALVLAVLAAPLLALWLRADRDDDPSGGERQVLTSQTKAAEGG